MNTLSVPSSTGATTVRARMVSLARRHWNRRTKFVLKTVVGLVVVAAVGRHVRQMWGRLHDQGRTVHVEPLWIALAIGLYLMGLCACGLFFRDVLRTSATPVSTLTAIRAYLISHLGKYVPGKALVVVMRVAMVTPYGAGAPAAAFATFYETLVMMAAGSLVATIGFLLVPKVIWTLALAVPLTVAFLVVVDPRVFPRLSRYASLTFGVESDALPKVSRRLLVTGLLWTVAGWILLGLSQVAVVRAISRDGVAVDLWPLVIAGVALATVGGFAVAVLPAGFGVREGVLMATLGPAIGEDTAVLAALALRLTWVIGELVGAAVVAAARPAIRGAVVP